MNIQYKRDINKSYLILEELQMNVEEHFHYKMILTNSFKQLLSVDRKDFNNQGFLYYEITSKQSFHDLYEQSLLSGTEIRLILRETKKLIEELNQYLVVSDYVVLDPQFIYIDASKEKLYFCLYPYNKQDFQGQFRKFAEELLNYINHKDEAAVQLAYQLYRLTRNNNFSITSLLEELSHDVGIERVSENRNDEFTEFQGSDQESSTYDEEPEEETGEKEEFPWGFIFFLLTFIGATCYLTYEILQMVENGKKFMMKDSMLVTVGLIVIGLIGIISHIVKKIVKDQKIEKQEIMNMKSKSNYQKKSKQQSYEHYEYHQDQTNKEETVLLGGSIKVEERKLVELFGKRKEYKIKTLPFTIGKVETMVQLVLSDPSISRLHAKIFEDNGQLYLQDLNSLNGTFKNGIILEGNEEVLLEPDDEIMIGRLKFTYC